MAVAPLRSAEEFELHTPEGQRLTGRRWAGRGAPFVLLHGLLDCAEGWDGMALTTRRPCIAFDLPGFGGSSLPTRPRISAYAEVVTWGLQQLEITGAVLIGHSLGGAVATAVAERASERIASLVLLAPAGFGHIRLAEAISIPGIRNLTAAALPLALSSRLVLTAAYTGVVTAGERPDPELLERLVRNASRATAGAREGTRAVVAAGRSRRCFARRRVDYAGPVTVLWGDHDHLVPLAHLPAVRRALPQADVHVWRGMGHHPQHERPVALAELLAAAAAGARRTRTAPPAPATIAVA